MITDKDFLKNKKQTLLKLEQAKKEGLVDKDIIPILDLINSSDDYYTSSSCYGRIVLLEIPEIGDKKNAKWLGKWHRKIDVNEFINASKKASKGMLWLLAQSPIIHVFSKNLESADKLVKTAISCGFKNSGFKSVEKNIVVEVISTERLDSPVGLDGKLFCDDKHLSLLVDIANDIFNKSTDKTLKLKKKLENIYL
jgi:tRNA wybutosine-synthesizing protein 3